MHGAVMLLAAILHALHPEFWGVPLLAIIGGLLAVYSVRRRHPV